jgi:hypothetical protein
MGDFESEQPTGDTGGAEADAADEPIDPVKAAEADAWLAQFRADNAAKLMEHNYQEAQSSYSEAVAEGAKRDYDLERVKDLNQGAAWWRSDAATFEQKAKDDAARHDEYEATAELDRHKADAADELAAKLGAEATSADRAAGRAEAEGDDLYEIQKEHEREYRLFQEEAVAARRIATNEALLQHPGDAAPAGPSGGPGAEQSAPAPEPDQP